MNVIISNWICLTVTTCLYCIFVKTWRDLLLPNAVCQAMCMQYASYTINEVPTQYLHSAYIVPTQNLYSTYIVQKYYIYVCNFYMSGLRFLYINTNFSKRLKEAQSIGAVKIFRAHFRVVHFHSMICQSSSDLQISNRFEKFRSFCIEVVLTIFF